MALTTKKYIDANTGFLDLIIGPMFSGKTSRIIQLFNEYIRIGIQPLVINYFEDKRYSLSDLSSHDKIMVPCVMIEHLDDIVNDENFNRSTVILINEGQFFKNINIWARKFTEPPFNKIIHICGLDGDFERNCFGNWLELIPYCDKVEKLTSICSKCKSNPGIFSYRITKETAQKVIGASNYIPLCRLCYNNM